MPSALVAIWSNAPSLRSRLVPFSHVGHSSATMAVTHLFATSVRQRVMLRPQLAPLSYLALSIAMMTADSGLTLPHAPATPFCCGRREALDSYLDCHIGEK